MFYQFDFLVVALRCVVVVRRCGVGGGGGFVCVRVSVCVCACVRAYVLRTPQCYLILASSQQTRTSIQMTPRFCCFVLCFVLVLS